MYVIGWTPDQVPGLPVSVRPTIAAPEMTGGAISLGPACGLADPVATTTSAAMVVATVSARRAPSAGFMAPLLTSDDGRGESYQEEPEASSVERVGAGVRR